MVEHDPSAARDDPEVAHEASDFNPKPVVWFGIALIGVAIVLHVVLWWMFDFWKERGGPTASSAAPAVAGGSARPIEFDPREHGLLPITPQTVERQRGLPPEPRIEGLAPRAEPRDLPATKEQMAASYGWVDARKGIVRIPVQRAMEIAVEHFKNEAAQAQGEPPVRAGPSDANSGRTHEHERSR